MDKSREPFIGLIVSESGIESKAFTCLKKARDYAKRMPKTESYVMTDIKGNLIFRWIMNDVPKGRYKSNSKSVFRGSPAVEHMAKEPYTRQIFKELVEIRRERVKAEAKVRRKPRNSYHAKQKRLYKAPSKCVTIKA